MSLEPDEIRRELERAGLTLTDAQWSALPRVARRRLGSHPKDTALERSQLAALARWLIAEFPPGWNGSPGR